jgi:hypothetical protein
MKWGNLSESPFVLTEENAETGQEEDEKQQVKDRVVKVL